MEEFQKWLNAEKTELLNFITPRINSDTVQCNIFNGAHSKDVYAIEIGNTVSSLTRKLKGTV